NAERPSRQCGSLALELNLRLALEAGGELQADHAVDIAGLAGEGEALVLVRLPARLVSAGPPAGHVGTEEQARRRLGAIEETERQAVAAERVAELAGRRGAAGDPVPLHLIVLWSLRRDLHAQLRLPGLHGQRAARPRPHHARAVAGIAGLAGGTADLRAAGAAPARADRAVGTRVGRARGPVGLLRVRRAVVAHAVTALGHVAGAGGGTALAGLLRVRRARLAGAVAGLGEVAVSCRRAARRSRGRRGVGRTGR